MLSLTRTVQLKLDYETEDLDLLQKSIDIQ